MQIDRQPRSEHQPFVFIQAALFLAVVLHRSQAVSLAQPPQRRVDLQVRAETLVLLVHLRDRAADRQQLDRQTVASIGELDQPSADVALGGQPFGSDDLGLEPLDLCLEFLSLRGIRGRLREGRPQHVDRVAVRFPSLIVQLDALVERLLQLDHLSFGFIQGGQAIAQRLLRRAQPDLAAGDLREVLGAAQEGFCSPARRFRGGCAPDRHQTDDEQQGRAKTRCLPLSIVRAGTILRIGPWRQTHIQLDRHLANGICG